MKTILYQPIFINPQAYFVFPQLYHIEKGDSYIEPANITGQLIINNLSEGLTLTPTVNVIQDSNQVDFSLFKGKHIRISQYTNIGAVVLGEWYIPGTPTPPEPEQPDWFKESIVAWYSPYCKQKLTNYDVIEAYVEDFTKWAYRDSRGIAKITNNTIVITNVVETNNIVEDDNEPYSDLTIRVTGVTENKYLIVRQGRGKPETHIKKDGVYTFKDNNLYFGFGVSVIGECNITITQLPTSILKDFSGNEHDAYLYAFKGKLNSGVGIYAQDFKNWNYGSAINSNISTKSYNKFHIVKKKADNWFGFTIGIPKNNYYNQTYKLKFSINKKIDDIKFNVVSTDGNLITTTAYSVYVNDGSIIDVPIISEEIFNNKEETNIYYDFGTNKDIEIDVELIANYPNQLCYDGKSYAVAYGLPILTDYTVIANRTWFAEKVDNGAFMSKALEQNGAFILEYKQGDKWNTYSYYSATNINIDKDNSIVYQTKNKYNEQTIYPGDKQDTDTLFIGTIRKDDSRSFIGCHGDILLFNRTLTDDELDLVKEYINKNINNVLNGGEKIETVNIDSSYLTNDSAYYGLNINIGQNAPNEITEIHGYSGFKTDVKKGQVIIIKSTNNTNITPWALSNKSNIITQISSIKGTGNLETYNITVENDGYLYTNQNTNTKNNFLIQITTKINSEIGLIKQVENNTKNINSLKKTIKYFETKNQKLENGTKNKTCL